MKSILLLLFTFTSLFSQTFVYECQDNKDFILQLKGDTALLFTKETSVLQTATASFTKETSIPLDRVPSASGEKYEKDGTVFLVHGYEAILDTPTKTYRACSNNRYKAVWEDAKLRGTKFRATGNEPGWYLEIGEGENNSLLVMNYGSDKYELSLSKPFRSKDTRARRYKISGFVDILIEDRRCTDSMTGHRFESSVRVKIGGKVYRGCGKSLH